MFARKRPAVTFDQLGCLVGKAQIGLNSLVRLQSEVDACVNEALPEMPVQRAEITMLVEQRAKIAQIIPDIVWRNCRVFPSFPRVWLVWNTRRCAQAGIANFPNHSLMRRVVYQAHGWRIRLRF